MIFKLITKLTKHVVVRFIIAGGTSAMVDLVALYIFNVVFGMQYLLAAILAFLVAFGFSFTLHKYWTFKSHHGETHKQAMLYFGTSLFGLFLNTILMYIFVDHVFAVVFAHDMKIRVMASQFVVGILVAFSSFFISRKFVFKHKANEVKVEIQ